MRGSAMTLELLRNGDLPGERLFNKPGNDESSALVNNLEFAKVVEGLSLQQTARLMCGVQNLSDSERSTKSMTASDHLNFSQSGIYLCAEQKGETPKDPNEEKLSKSGYKAFLEGKYDDAERDYKSLLELNQKNYGKDSKEVAFAYELLGNTCEKAKRYADAKDYYKQGADVSSKASGKDHYDTGLFLHSVAQMDQQLKNWKDAAASYKSAVDILAAEKNSPSSDNGRMNEATRALKGYAEVLNKLGDKKGADEQLKRAAEIEKNYLTQPNKGVIYY